MLPGKLQIVEAFFSCVFFYCTSLLTVLAAVFKLCFFRCLAVSLWLQAGWK